MNISSITSGVSGADVSKTRFERNSDDYGPVAAAALGLADAAVDQASATVSLSKEALAQAQGVVHDTQAAAHGLADDVAEAWHDGVAAIGHGVDVVEDAVVSAWHDTEDAVAEGCHEVKQGIEDAATAVKQAAVSAYEAVAEASDQVAGYASMAWQSLRDVV